MDQSANMNIALAGASAYGGSLPNSKKDRRTNAFTNKQWKKRKHKRKMVEASRRKNR